MKPAQKRCDIGPEAGFPPDQPAQIPAGPGSDRIGGGTRCRDKSRLILGGQETPDALCHPDQADIGGIADKGRANRCGMDRGGRPRILARGQQINVSGTIPAEAILDKSGQGQGQPPGQGGIREIPGLGVQHPQPNKARAGLRRTDPPGRVEKEIKAFALVGMAGADKDRPVLPLPPQPRAPE